MGGGQGRPPEEVALATMRQRAGWPGSDLLHGFNFPEQVWGEIISGQQEDGMGFQVNGKILKQLPWEEMKRG